jgi:hypothetical protein
MGRRNRAEQAKKAIRRSGRPLLRECIRRALKGPPNPVAQYHHQRLREMVEGFGHG